MPLSFLTLLSKNNESETEINLIPLSRFHTQSFNKDLYLPVKLLLCD